MTPIKEHAPITNIVAIDFETANEQRSSACAVAGVRFDLASGQKASRMYTLINPQDYFDPFNISIHGITPDMVQDAPLYPEAMRGFYALLDAGSLIVAHNSAFDMSVLRASYKDSAPDIPDIMFTCTYRLAKRILPASVSYTLPEVAAACGVEGLNHHNAESDAEICGKVFLSMLSHYSSIDEMLTAANLNIGTIQAGEYNGVHKLEREHTGIYNGPRAKGPLPAFTTGPESPFFEKTVVFTGALLSMLRKDAENMIIQIGGKIGAGVTKKVDYLITGYQAPNVLKGHEKSAKVMAAEKLLAAGHRIEVIPEEEFLKML